jgi:hypothetical protein
MTRGASGSTPRRVHPAGRARGLEGMTVRAQMLVTCDARRVPGCHGRFDVVTSGGELAGAGPVPA